MSGFLAAAMIASTAISLYGQKKEADAEKASLRAKAELNAIQADEILARFEINKKQMEREGEKVVGRFNVIAGKLQGSSISSSRLELMTDIREKIMFEQRASEFDARMMRMTGQALRNQMDDLDSAQKIRTISTILGGGAKAYAASKD